MNGVEWNSFGWCLTITGRFTFHFSFNHRFYGSNDNDTCGRNGTKLSVFVLLTVNDLLGELKVQNWMHNWLLSLCLALIICCSREQSLPCRSDYQCDTGKCCASWTCSKESACSCQDNTDCKDGEDCVYLNNTGRFFYKAYPGDIRHCLSDYDCQESSVCRDGKCVSDDELEFFYGDWPFALPFAVGGGMGLLLLIIGLCIALRRKMHTIGFFRSSFSFVMPLLWTACSNLVVPSPA